MKRVVALLCCLAVGILVLLSSNGPDGGPVPEITEPLPPLPEAGTAEPPVLPTGATRPESMTREIDAGADERLEITGTVFAQDGSTPVKAMVRASLIDRPASLRDFYPSGRAGADGRFRIRGLPAGRYRLRVDPDDDLFGAPPDPAPVVKAGARDVRIILDPRAILTVKVVAEADGPERPVTTFRVLDSTGRRISNHMCDGERPSGIEVKVRPGLGYRIEVAVPGYRQVGTGEVILGVNDLLKEVIIPIAPIPEAEFASLTLNLLDALGSPVRRIVLQRTVSASFTSITSLTPDDGRVELSLPPGPNELNLVRSDGAKPLEEPYLELPIEVDLAPGERAVLDVTVPCGGWMRVILPPPTEEHPRGKPTMCMDRVEDEPIRGKRIRWAVPPSPVLLRPGAYTLDLQYPGMDAIRKTVVIRPGEVTDVLIP